MQGGATDVSGILRMNSVCREVFNFSKLMPVAEFPWRSCRLLYVVAVMTCVYNRRQSQVGNKSHLRIYTCILSRNVFQTIRRRVYHRTTRAGRPIQAGISELLYFLIRQFLVPADRKPDAISAHNFINFIIAYAASEH